MLLLNRKRPPISPKPHIRLSTRIAICPIWVLLLTQHGHRHNVQYKPVFIVNLFIDLIFLLIFHDDVIKMERFSALLVLCRMNSPVTVNSPHKGQRWGALMFPLICTWTNGWVNNRDADNLRCHWAHYDVTVMISFNSYDTIVHILRTTPSAFIHSSITHCGIITCYGVMGLCQHWFW